MTAVTRRLISLLSFTSHQNRIAITRRKLEKLLVVGATIEYGPKYKKFSGTKLDSVTLVLGHFDYYDGLGYNTESCVAVWDEESDDWDSIYHLFGDELEYFMDCKIITTST